MHALKPRIHSYLDYAAIIFLFVAPSLFSLSGTPAALLYSLAVAYLGLVLLTAYPGGAVRIIPFTVHGAIEFAVAIALMAAPWAFQFAADGIARNLFVVLGASLFVVWLMTDYRAADMAPYRRHAAHH